MSLGEFKQRKSLVACAVEVLRHHPNEGDLVELTELTKRLAVHRQIQWSFGHEIGDALRRALRYDPRDTR